MIQLISEDEVVSMSHNVFVYENLKDNSFLKGNKIIS